LLTVTREQPLIAIVDDDESVLRALKRLLRSAGLRVEAFGGGEEFLASLSDHRPDCVVLDIHMPGVTGFDVQARLAEFDPTLPVVIITGYDSPETRDRVLAGGAVSYLRKPIGDQKLLDAITEALRPQE
jgi:FixJ family two-component response regulator